MADVSTVGIAVAAAVAVLLVLALVMVVARGRRRRRSDQHELLMRVSELNGHMESIVRELSGSLRPAHEDSRRARALGELGGSIDLDEVLARTLEAAHAIEGADAA